MIRIAGVALIGVFTSVVLKRINQNMSFCVSVLTVFIVFLMLYDDITNLISVFKGFSGGYGVSDNHVKLLLKVLGISYITQFASSIAEESGEKLIARKIEFAGKIFIVSLSMPLLLNLLNTIITLF